MVGWCGFIIWLSGVSATAAGGLFYDNYIGGAQLTSAAVYGIVVADFLKGKTK